MLDCTAKIGSSNKSTIVTKTCVTFNNTCTFGNFQNLVVSDISSQALVLRFLDNKIIRIKTALVILIESALYIQHRTRRQYKYNIITKIPGT